MNFQIPRRIIFALAVIVASGCESVKVTHYTSPEVTGRVLAADTHQPLARAEVEPAGQQSSWYYWTFGSPKGGALLMEPVPSRTDADGRFVLEGKSVIALFRKPGWSSEPLVFSHPGYETFQTNYTGTNVTNRTGSGAPVVDLGDVLLQPKSE